MAAIKSYGETFSAEPKVTKAVHSDRKGKYLEVRITGDSLDEARSLEHSAMAVASRNNWNPYGEKDVIGPVERQLMPGEWTAIYRFRTRFPR